MLRDAALQLRRNGSVVVWFFMSAAKHTPAETVIWLFDFARGDFWLDGGWGVDALVGRQTREHGDVDIVIEQSVAEGLAPRLHAEGFEDEPRDDTRACNFVLGCEERGLVDFHIVNFDAHGDGTYGIPKPEGMYPAEAFSGRGTVLGHPIKCMSAAFQFESHNAVYVPREKDYADMRALAEALSVLPPGRFVENDK